MRVNGGLSNFASINNSMFNALAQGKASVHANRLSNSFFNTSGKTVQGIGARPGAISPDTARSVGNIKTSADSLAGVLRGLTGIGIGNRVVAMSSHPGVVSIEHTGIKPSSVSRMEIRIDQLAAGQANEGSRMTASSAFEGSIGTNRFSIRTGDMTTNLSVNIQQGDTNRAVQQRMADAIISSGAGVRASVAFDAEAGTSMLRLEGTTTGGGSGGAFTVADSGSGSLVAQIGANEVVRQGQDAIFRVGDGAERRSASNTVFLGNGVTATLGAASSEPVAITWGQERTNVSRSSVEDMVRGFNNLFSAAAERTGDPRSQMLASSMLNMASAFASSLANIGIGFGNSGKMTINTQRMDSAEADGSLNRFFSGTGSNSFATQLTRLADNVSRNPGNFVSNSLFGGNMMGNFGYNSFGSPTQFNPFGSGVIHDFTL